MPSFQSTGAVAIAALSALIAGPAAATVDYQGYIIGQLVSAAGTTSSFSQATGAQPYTPFQFGRTGTTWQVGAVGLAQYGGESSANVDLAPPNYSYPNDHATKLTAHSAIDYRIDLAGSGADTLVPVEVKALGSISWTQNGDVQAVFRFQDYNSPSGATTIFDVIDQNAAGRSRIAGNDSFSVDSILWLNPNDQYSVTLGTDAIGDISQFNDLTSYGQDNALVDPTFTVVGAYAQRWTIQGVPQAAPEPAVWAMLIAGLGLTGAGLRRRRVSVATRTVGTSATVAPS